MEKIIDQLTDEQWEAFFVARRAVSRDRAHAICELKHWQHGGCLMRERPAIPDVSDEENTAIHALWMTLSGSSCWMSAAYILRNNEKEAVSCATTS